MTLQHCIKTSFILVTGFFGIPLNSAQRLSALLASPYSWPWKKSYLMGGGNVSSFQKKKKKIYISFADEVANET